MQAAARPDTANWRSEPTNWISTPVRLSYTSLIPGRRSARRALGEKVQIIMDLQVYLRHTGLLSPEAADDTNYNSVCPGRNNR